VKTWDVIIVGAGIIGLSLAISLRRQGLKVLIIERGEPGREASYAAAGMLSDWGKELPAPLEQLAHRSSGDYPEFVHELEDESGKKVDLREQGTILFSSDGDFPDGAEPLSGERLAALEPALEAGARPWARGRVDAPPAAFVAERSLDPRALVEAAIRAARHRNVDLSSGTEAKALLVAGDRACGVRTEKTSYASAVVVNCAGAWAGSIAPYRLPIRPVKGQMLSAIGGRAPQHVLRSAPVYLVPRGDGRVVIGSTLEDAGFNKQTDVNTIQRLFAAALELAPGLTGAKLHEAWAGLRPAAPDELPLLGESAIRGYFLATGHYRDGILLAPITAELVTNFILGRPITHDLSAFSPQRFAT
jgi:glycine oxidase